MENLANQRILLGITGSIAAYKAALLTRLFVKAGAQVQVVMTEAATQFIAPLTLQALSGNPVRTTLWDDAAELGMGHIELARWADHILIAPASADTLARLAQGRADDLLATLCLATTAPISVAPAMNTVMWEHAATQHNMQLLAERGVHILGPGQGELAERESGAGRMLEPETIVNLLLAQRRENNGLLAGQQVVITAGPTQETIDPVRYLTNRASGRMGFTLAAACAAAGANVRLIAGPTSLATPFGVTRVDVESAADMHAAVMQAMPATQIFISAAAVADYRPTQAAEHKIKKSAGDYALSLVRTRDIIADVAQQHPNVFTLGFAAETQNMPEFARKKRQRKGLDMVAGNYVGPQAAFGREDNALYVCWEGGAQELPQNSKLNLAKDLVALIARRLPKD